MAQRKIEVFTAGCFLCLETLALVKESVAACGCEVIERRSSGSELCPEAQEYGVRVMPTVVLNGQVVYEGRINSAQAALLARPRRE